MGGGPSKSSKSSSLAQGKRTGLNESSVAREREMKRAQS
jgi:hypothetical protein